MQKAGGLRAQRVRPVFLRELHRRLRNAQAVLQALFRDVVFEVMNVFFAQTFIQTLHKRYKFSLSM